MAQILIIYIGLHALNGLILKYLSIEGVSTSQLLVLRGLGCMGWAILWSVKHRKSLWPTLLRVQLIRMGVAGLSLYCIIYSYTYIRATSVALISRMDVALLLLVAPFIGEKTLTRQKILATLTLLATGWFAISGRLPSEQIAGYGFAFIGTCGITLGYLLLRHASKKENDGVVAGVAGLSITLVGLLVGFSPTDLLSIPWTLLIISIGSGLVMFWIYQLTVLLYRKAGVVIAEFPTLIATLVLLPLESVLLNMQVDLSYVVFIVSSTLVLALIILTGRISWTPNWRLVHALNKTFASK